MVGDSLINGISIHALLAESDGCGYFLAGEAVHISIHALLAESDRKLKKKRGFERKFLSTLSLRRATIWITLLEVVTSISIHALLAESDRMGYDATAKAGKFLSTLSLRRATCSRLRSMTSTSNFYPRSPCGERHRRIPASRHRQEISIHALLAESDLTVAVVSSSLSSFLSTLSLRRATSRSTSPPRRWSFLSTLSLRRATVLEAVVAGEVDISIHALLAESDPA